MRDVSEIEAQTRGGYRETQQEWRPPTVSRRQLNYATRVCFFAWVFAVYDFILFGTLLPRRGERFHWSAGDQASINTWVTLGTAVVAFGIGPIVDRLGRRK